LSEPTPYVGRFAPSPTGPLHFGSLLAAVASYLEARARNGQWLLRVEDIDPPREQAGAKALILTALELYGFEWDGAIIYQSDSRGAHDTAVQNLLKEDHAYRCGCSRRDLADAPQGPLGIIYPGTCRDSSDAQNGAVRVRTTDEPLAFEDRLQGAQSQRLETVSGDFIVLRRDDLIAYQLAVVVDDHLQGVTDIVRGIDLMDSTPRQIWLQRLLGFTVPSYAHIPVALNLRDQKLSKSTGAGAIPLDRMNETLVAALAALQQRPPDELRDASMHDIWEWAHAHWSIKTLKGRTQITHQ